MPQCHKPLSCLSDSVSIFLPKAGQKKVAPSEAADVAEASSQVPGADAAAEDDNDDENPCEEDDFA